MENASKLHELRKLTETLCDRETETGGIINTICDIIFIDDSDNDLKVKKIQKVLKGIKWNKKQKTAGTSIQD